MLEIIKNMRSTRTYIDKEVEEKVLEILNTAMQLPSSKYFSHWGFIEIDLNDGYQYE